MDWWTGPTPEWTAKCRKILENPKSIEEQARETVLKEIQKMEREKMLYHACFNESASKKSRKKARKAYKEEFGIIETSRKIKNNTHVSETTNFAEGTTTEADATHEDHGKAESTDDSPMSHLNHNASEFEDARQLSITQDRFVAIEPKEGVGEDIAANCRLIGFNKRLDVLCPLTPLRKELGFIHTRTFHGFQYIAQAPATLVTAVTTPEMTGDNPSENASAGELNLSRDTAEAADSDHFLNVQLSGPESYPDPAVSPAPMVDSVRTFANDLIYVGKSTIEGAGFGLFANRPIQYGQHILLERPLLRTSTMNLFKEFDKLEPEKQAILFTLSGFHPRDDAEPIEKIFNANAFQTDHGLDAVFPISSNFNHACELKRNVGYVWDKRRKLMVFTATEDIAADKELFIVYGHSVAGLKSRFGFICKCGGCSSAWLFSSGFDSP